MKNVKLLYLIISLLCVMSGCKEDEKVEPEVEIFVEETRLSGRERIVLNCKGDEDKLVTKGIGRRDYFYGNGEHQRFSTSVTDFSILHKPPIYKEFGVELYGHSIHLYVESGTQVDYIDITELDSTFSQLIFVRNWVNECILFTGNDEMWVAYESISQGIKRTKFLIVNVALIGNYNYTIVDPSEDIMSISSWYLLNNELYVSNGGSAYKISKDGNTTEIIRSGIFRMFELDNILWAISYGDWIYYSADGGETWELFSEGIESLSLFCLENIDGRVIGYWRGGLIEFSSEIAGDGSTTLSIRTINTDGMGNAEITSLAKFNGRYYIGTYNGLFSKSEENFFSYVE